MQNNDSYKLLFNNLWQHKTQVDDKFAKADAKSIIKFDITHKTNISANIQPVTIVRETIPSIPLQRKQTNEVINSSENNLITNWDELVNQISNCTKCGLCEGRKNVVIERGNRNAKIMFVGEGPGENEDIQGKPFVGVSGQLLDKMIIAMKLNPEHDIYICNVVKCRPPFNRNPEESEILRCNNYLLSQINLVKPNLIIALGRFASQTLLKTNLATGKLRGKIHKINGAINVVVTYHPSYLLRNPAAKKSAWEDLQLAMTLIH